MDTSSILFYHGLNLKAHLFASTAGMTG